MIRFFVFFSDIFSLKSCTGAWSPARSGGEARGLAFDLCTSPLSAERCSRVCCTVCLSPVGTVPERLARSRGMTKPQARSEAQGSGEEVSAAALDRLARLEGIVHTDLRWQRCNAAARSGLHAPVFKGLGRLAGRRRKR